MIIRAFALFAALNFPIVAFGTVSPNPVREDISNEPTLRVEPVTTTATTAPTRRCPKKYRRVLRISGFSTYLCDEPDDKD
jgi:hypothetical protein